MGNNKITKRSDDYSEWYLDVVRSADLAEHSPVKGCMIIKPYGYAIWELIQKYINELFKKSGVKNMYFPLFIPESYIKKESKHVEGFAPEIAVVTYAGGKKLEEPLVVRPTSETIIGESFSKWVHSYRDLPIVINQWANVVRWELRTRFFLRTSEFLWQEGHTAHASKKEADERALEMIEVYRKFAEEYASMYVFVGKKSESEKFAGADVSYTIESMMQDGKALQAGTSHMLGQNFAKAFSIRFMNENKESEYVWQTSWGLSTRIIGGIIMMHSDDDGLVLPPKLAPISVVIIPILKKDEDINRKLLDLSSNIENMLNDICDIHDIVIDMDTDKRVGEKLYEWEKKGVPVRIEIGEKELSDGAVSIFRRDTKEKNIVAINGIRSYVDNLLIDIQSNLYIRSKKLADENTIEVSSFDEFKDALSKDSKFVYIPWCGRPECEENVKELTKASTRCFPLDQKGYNHESKCVICSEKSVGNVIFARSY